MFFVTFHETIANVYAYDDDGNLLNPSAPDVIDPSGQALKELRGLYLDRATGLLYVANGAATTSNVLCFEGSETSYKYLSTFIESPAAGGPKSVIHPYALAFDGAGRCYVSSQDSNVVAAFDVASDGQSASTAFHESPYLSGVGLAGKFLLEQQHVDISHPDTASPRHSVRQRGSSGTVEPDPESSLGDSLDVHADP
jgi:hypothetical protein